MNREQQKKFEFKIFQNDKHDNMYHYEQVTIHASVID